LLDSDIGPYPHNLLTKAPKPHSHGRRRHHDQAPDVADRSEAARHDLVAFGFPRWL